MLLLWQIPKRPVQSVYLILPVGLDSISRTRFKSSKSTDTKVKTKGAGKEKHGKLAPLPVLYPSPKLLSDVKKQPPLPVDFGTFVEKSEQDPGPRCCRFPRIARGLGFCCLGFEPFWPNHREMVPETGRKRIRWVPDSVPARQAKMCDARNIEVFSTEDQSAVIGPITSTPPMFEQFMDKIVLSAGLDHYKWKLVVVESTDSIGGSPGPGYVFITTGLIKLLTQMELFQCLAHEIAHIKASHHSERLSVYILQGIPLALLRLFSHVPILRSVSKDLLHRHLLWGMRESRKHEHEADYIGMMLAASCGIHPQVAIDMMEKFRGNEKSLIAKGAFQSLIAKGAAGAAASMKKGQRFGVEIQHETMTHPPARKRIEQMRGWIPEALQLREKALAEKTSNYQQQLVDRWFSMKSES